jgi:hypothetical protein
MSEYILGLPKKKQLVLVETSEYSNGIYFPKNLTGKTVVYYRSGSSKIIYKVLSEQINNFKIFYQRKMVKFLGVIFSTVDSDVFIDGYKIILSNVLPSYTEIEIAMS